MTTKMSTADQIHQLDQVTTKVSTVDQTYYLAQETTKVENLPRSERNDVKSTQAPRLLMNEYKKVLRVSILGSSMVREMGKHVSHENINACSYTMPGHTAGMMQTRRHSVLHPEVKTEDALVFMSGTNNMIQEHTVKYTIIEVDNLMGKIRRLRPKTQIIITGIINRNLDKYRQENVKRGKVNNFLQNR